MSADNLAYKELLFSCTVVNANMICVLHVKMKRRTNKIKKDSNHMDSLRKEKRFAFILIILALSFCLFNLSPFCVVIVQIIYQYFSYSRSNQLDCINFFWIVHVI